MCRLSDALPLTASLADDQDAFANELCDYERQAKRIVKHLSQEVRLRPADHGAASIEAGYFVFHYITANNVVYLTLAERAYPRRLAFAFLDDVRREFETVYGGQVNLASRPYEMIRFDTFIKKTKRVYMDANASGNVERLHSDLLDVKNIMTRSIHEVLGRGERLDTLQNTSSQLSAESKKYLRRAKRATWILKMRQYTPVVAVVVILCVALWFFKLRSGAF